MIDRKPNREITDPEELAFVLDRAELLRLGMCVDNKPYVVPMNFGLSEDRKTIYLHSSCRGKKVGMLKENPSVCFEMEIGTALIQADNPCGWSMKFKSIVGYGTVHFLDDPKEKLEGLKAVMKHYTDAAFADEDFRAKAVTKVCVMKLEIESMRGAKHGYDD